MSRPPLRRRHVDRRRAGHRRPGATARIAVDVEEAPVDLASTTVADVTEIIERDAHLMPRRADAEDVAEDATIEDDDESTEEA